MSHPVHHAQDPDSPAIDFLNGGGTMGAQMRAKDWSATPLGPPETWPQSLKVVVRIMLASRYAMWMAWGPELTFFYNDAYRPTLGVKQSWALGFPARTVWEEIWPDIGPRIETVLGTGQATWDEALLLFLERSGYPEETYHTFSYSPLADDGGAIVGMLCVVTEETERVLGERRLALLRDVAAGLASTGTEAEVFSALAASLGADGRDLPFSLVYLFGADGAAELALAAGIPAGHPAAPIRLEPGEATAAWPAEALLTTSALRTVSDLEARFGEIIAGAWDRPVREALLLPLAQQGQEQSAGFLVAGLNPYRRLDADYGSFLHLLAGQIASGIGNARAYEAERRRAEALAELDRAKTAFFSNVSHEFRTPLTLMLGPIEDALAEAADPGERERLALLHRNALRLQKLVNTLLDFSRIEAGRVQASYVPTDLAAFTAELAGAFRPAIETAGLRFAVECAEISQPVYVDPDMWEKIVLNLLSNALKFTFVGEIGVALREAGGQVEVTVRDTGIGIPPEELPRLFERFHRVEGARGRTHEGTGIGLALVQELAKLHGGAVRVESTPGAGSTFTVTLPLGAAHLPAERIGVAPTLASTALAPTAFVEEALRWLPGGEESLPDGSEPPAPRSAPPGRRARVLLADDNADMRAYVRRLLSSRYEVEAVPDGLAALAAARREPPDLVVTDVMMPGLDGFGLLRELRTEPETATVPVLLLSARAGEEARLEGLEAGADDYLIKPFSARELLARAASQLELARVRQLAAEEMKAEARRKDEFLAMLAHELRNPLSPIATSAAILQRQLQGEDERLRRQPEIIERQVRTMSRLLDDLLDISRITRGKVILQPERLDARAVVRAAVEVSSALIRERGHDLVVSVPESPIWLKGDPVRLEQILANLLNNAARYTEPRGRIELSLRLAPDPAGKTGAVAELRVRDNGIGIAPELLPQIFDLFTQGERSLDRSQGGLGIGLTLVKSLVEMHGGTVQASSAGTGRGSELIVRLPAISPAGEQPDASEPDPPAESAAARRVLVVDDNKDAADLLAELVGYWGYEVRAVYGGLPALETAREWRPDAVLLDLGMPGIDGYEVARRLRETDPSRSLLLIAVSGYGQEEHRQLAQKAGIDHHLTKPANAELLEQLLHDKLGHCPA